MSLHYLVKYECQKTGGNLKYVLWLMVNDKVVQPSICVMSYFATNLSLNLLVKEFFLNRWISGKVTGKWLIMSYAPFALNVCPQKCRTRQISKISLLVYNGQKLLLVVVISIDRLMPVYYPQISYWRRPVFTARCYASAVLAMSLCPSVSVCHKPVFY